MHRVEAKGGLRRAYAAGVWGIQIMAIDHFLVIITLTIVCIVVVSFASDGRALVTSSLAADIHSLGAAPTLAAGRQLFQISVVPSNGVTRIFDVFPKVVGVDTLVPMRSVELSVKLMIASVVVSVVGSAFRFRWPSTSTFALLPPTAVVAFIAEDRSHWHIGPE